MPRVCTICRHPDREAMDRALVSGEPYRVVANRFEASASALFRHQEHLPKALVKAREAQEVAHADDLLAQVKDLGERALRVLAAAEESGDLRAATGAIREARGCLELLGKVTGELFERHAHLHAAPSPVEAETARLEQARSTLEYATNEERQILQCIARRLAIRAPGKPEDREASLRSLAREIEEILNPELRERRHAEFRQQPP
jgi:hypothetical protein